VCVSVTVVKNRGALEPRAFEKDCRFCGEAAG
jgi:hypothetical protein